ncbi:MAG TPA: hypothetical protein VF730_08075 [Terracidiphilus sp.]
MGMAQTLDDARRAAMAPSVIQHPMHAMVAPIGPPPPPVQMAMDSAQPEMPSNSPTVARMTPMQEYEGVLGRKLMADYTKDENPWGTPQNHPGLMGKIGHGLSRFVQNAQHEQGQLTPREAEEGRISGQLQNIEKERALENEQGAQAENLRSETSLRPSVTSSENALRGAQAEHEQAETNALQNPLPKFSVHETKQGPLFVNMQTGTAQHLTVDGVPVGPQLKLTQSQPIIGADGKPHTYMLDQNGQKVVDLGVHYERPVSVSVNAGEHAYEYANNQLNTLGKPISDLIMRMGRLRDTLAQGTPQADALIAPELLTVMAGGMGSGLRMNEAEIARIVGGRSNWESLKASMNKWQTDPNAARSITPAQQQQIRALVETVNQKLMAKQQILDNAANEMVETEDPQQQRRILADTRVALTKIDEGAGPSTASAPPPGAVGIGKGSDGKNYYVDANNKPLGVAP